MPQNRLVGLLLTSAAVGLVTPGLQAETLYWQGGTDVLTAANYFNNGNSTSNNTPTAGDILNIGAGGTAMFSGDGWENSFQKLQIGFNNAAALAAYSGTGVVEVGGGAKLDLTVGGADNPALRVGNVQEGTLLINGPGSSVTSANTMYIGYAPGQPNRKGTVIITDGGSLTVTSGNIRLGEGTHGTNPGNRGMQGHLEMHDEGSSITGVTMHIGRLTATSSYTQTNGTATLSGVVEVGVNNIGTANPNNGSSFSISGGVFNLGDGTGNDHFFVGRGNSIGATVNISGDAVVNVGQRYLMGGQTASGIVTNQTGGTLNTVLDVRVGDAATGDSTYNLSGTGVINATTGVWVARTGTATFRQTGGAVKSEGGALQVGVWQKAAATPVAPNGLYQISGGSLEVTIGNLDVGREFGGATAGDAFYGEFRVVGGDATKIEFGGNANFSDPDAGGVGTLAFELEGAESLSKIDVGGNVTFNAGSRLVFDVSNATVATQTSYDLLQSLSPITIDESLVFEGPDGWNYEAVEGGELGYVLRVFGPSIAPEDADFDGDGDVDGADFLAWQRGVGGANGTAPENGNANGDAFVDGADLAIWKDQFGPASVPASAPVPEPGGVALLATAIGLIGAARVRRAKQGA